MTKTYKTLLALLATGLLSCGLFSQNALAVEGSILMNGTAKADQASSDGTITTIEFSNPWVTTIFRDGDYAGVPSGTSVTFADFMFANDDADGGGLQATLVAPVTPLWTFTYMGDVFEFDLLALTSGAVVPTFGGNYSMGFTGTGIAYINGVGSSATWALNGSGRAFTFVFSSSSTSATEVPDGGATVALLGIGLVGIATLRRKLKAV